MAEYRTVNYELFKGKKNQEEVYNEMQQAIQEHIAKKYNQQKIQKECDELIKKNEELEEQLKTQQVQLENQNKNNDPNNKDNNNNNSKPIQQTNMLGSEKEPPSPVQLPNLPKSESNNNNNMNNNNNATNNNLEIQQNGTHVSFAGQKDQGKPSNPQINQIGASSAGINEQIEQLKLTIAEKDRSLIQVSAKIEENSQLKESLRILEEDNSELRIRVKEMQQNSNMGGTQQSQQIVQLKDQLNKLNFENARQEQKNLEMQKNFKEQEKVMEYLVAENSRLIIKNYVYSQRNINNIH